MKLDKLHALKTCILFFYFSILAFFLWNYDIGYAILPLLVLSAVVWFGYEYLQGVKQKELQSALKIGLFLMVFDFIIQNIGAALGYWQVVETALPVVYVPIEIMLLTLIGGTAWALAQPKKFNKINTTLDIALFSVFGMIGESLLIKNGVMFYAGGWTSAHAFIGYFITWILLHYIRHRQMR